jgi:hypothetical protein
MTRELALVPVELYGSFRHQGGVSTGRVDRTRRGLTGVPGPAPRLLVQERLSTDAVAAVRKRFGHPLPAAYVHALARANGGQPNFPAVHAEAGFVFDQRLFGLARGDWLQDLVYANAWFADRLTADFLAVAYVHGGLLAVKVRGGDEGSVWWYDDDDPRDDDSYRAAEVCDRLLHRIADDFTAFWLALGPVPDVLAERAAALAAHAGPGLVHPSDLGTALPPSHRR